MKRWLGLFLLVAMIAATACQEDEEPGPPEELPVKENTVQLIVSNAWDPCYSPSGDKIVFVEAYHLATFNLATRKKENITPDFASADFSPRKPAWLKGDVVAFVRKEEGTGKYRLWTVAATGGDVGRYDVDVDANSSVAGEETGEYVYYTGDGDRLIYRLELESGEKTMITANHITGFAHYDPVKTPGASLIYYIERQVPFNTQPHSEYVNEISAEGGGVPRILLNTDKPFLEGFAISPDDKYMIFAHRDGLFAYEHKAGIETWLTRAPSKWTDKDRNPCYAPDGAHFVFARSGNIYICEAL